MAGVLLKDQLFLVAPFLYMQAVVIGQNTKEVTLRFVFIFTNCFCLEQHIATYHLNRHIQTTRIV